jgi:hypothetical protein
MPAVATLATRLLVADIRHQDTVAATATVVLRRVALHTAVAVTVTRVAACTPLQVELPNSKQSALIPALVFIAFPS